MTRLSGLSGAPAVTHVIFDVDGLLLDTEVIYTDITSRIVSRFGKTFDWSVKSNMIGRVAKESAQYLVDTLELPITADEYLAERDALLRAGFAECNALPGARELVHHLHRHRIPMAVATSSARAMYEIKITRHRGWFALFDAVICGDDGVVARGKPAPDVFLAAAARIQAPPAATLVFEDSPAGLAAGCAAGMRVIAVPDPQMDKSRYAEADLVLDSMSDFDPTIYGLPGFVIST